MQIKLIFRLVFGSLSLVLSATRASLSFQVVRTFQNLDLELQSYLFTYFFEVLGIQFIIHYEVSKAAIQKC